MAHFYASISGNRGEATRMGSKASGITGHIRGWDSGVRVNGRVDDEGRDVFDVYATGGSRGVKSDQFIATITGDELKVTGAADIDPLTIR